MEDAAMRRLPEKKIWQTIDGLIADLHIADDKVESAYAHAVETGYDWHSTDLICAIAEVRTIADEILRWGLL